MKLPKCQRNKDVPCNYMWLLHYCLPITHLSLFSVSCSSDLWSDNTGLRRWPRGWSTYSASLRTRVQISSTRIIKPEVIASICQGSYSEKGVGSRGSPWKVTVRPAQNKGKSRSQSPFVFWPPHTHFGMDLQDAIAVYKCFWIASRKISTLPTWKMYIYLSCGSQVLCCKIKLYSSVVVSLLKSF